MAGDGGAVLPQRGRLEQAEHQRPQRAQRAAHEAAAQLAQRPARGGGVIVRVIGRELEEADTDDRDGACATERISTSRNNKEKHKKTSRTMRDGCKEEGR